MRPALVLALLAVARTATAATVEPLLKDFRIALRLGPDRVLIIGDSVELAADATSDFRGEFRSESQLPRLAPLWELLFEAPRELSTLGFEPRANWKPGDHWHLFTGSTVPIRIKIERVGVSFAGGQGYWIATARFPNSAQANLVAGMRAEEYLAAPVRVRTRLTGVPLMPASGAPGDSGLELLLRNARDKLRDHTDSDFLKGPFFSDTVSPDVYALRWRPDARRSFLFTQVTWSDDRGLPLVQSAALIEESHNLTILKSDVAHNRIWLDGLQYVFPYLNAWTIGNRYFVLIHDSGPEASYVHLDEILPDGKLRTTGVEYAWGS